MSEAGSDGEIRSRVLRACDQCSQSKQRCDGKLPCYRCTVRDNPCRYEKAVRKRGRQRRSKFLNNHRILAPGPIGWQNSPDGVQGHVDFNAPGNNRLGEGFQCEPPHPLSLFSCSEDEIIAKLAAGTRLTGGGHNAVFEDSLFLAGSPKSPPGVAQSSAGGTDRPSLSDLSSLSGEWSDYVNSISKQAPPRSIENWLDKTPPNKSGSGFLTDPVSHSRENMQDRFSQRDSPGYQQYPGLEPLLPYLQDILSANDAAEMLDMFFNAQKNPRWKAMSPYILTDILHPTKPRPTSPVLLLVILFCIAHTADAKIFDPPGARQRIIADLYHLVLEVMEPVDVDNYFRTPDGWQFHQRGGISKKEERSSVYYTANSGLIPDFLGSTDVILAVIILTMVISGGHFKADCLKWWAKAVRLVRFSGLNMEDEPARPQHGGIRDRVHYHESSKRSGIIAKEERRRLFWLIYCLDRHLALSFNSALNFPEGTFSVASPLPETTWLGLPTFNLSCLPTSSPGPPTQITGYSFFESFLPLSTVLGHIIDYHHVQSHPLLGRSVSQVSHDIEALIVQCEQGLTDLKKELENPIIGSHLMDGFHYSDSQEQLVIAYSSHMLHVFYILLHGKWDPIAMIENEDDWVNSAGFQTCAAHALGAVTAVHEILTLDPELTFMPYLFSIYLFHGSFILLLFVDRMPELGFNKSVKDVCETIIRAHEVSVVTLDTTFQKNIRRVFRSMLNDAQRADPQHSRGIQKARQREMLSLYRWTRNSHGLAC